MEALRSTPACKPSTAATMELHQSTEDLIRGVATAWTASRSWRAPAHERRGAGGHAPHPPAGSRSGRRRGAGSELSRSRAARNSASRRCVASSTERRSLAFIYGVRRIDSSTLDGRAISLRRSGPIVAAVTTKPLRRSTWHSMRWPSSVQNGRNRQSSAPELTSAVTEGRGFLHAVTMMTMKGSRPPAPWRSPGSCGRDWRRCPVPRTAPDRAGGGGWRRRRRPAWRRSRSCGSRACTARRASAVGRHRVIDQRLRGIVIQSGHGPRRPPQCFKRVINCTRRWNGGKTRLSGTATASTIVRKSDAFRLAPPTRAPPTSASARISFALEGFTEPPS